MLPRLFWDARQCYPVAYVHCEGPLAAFILTAAVVVADVIVEICLAVGTHGVPRVYINE